MKRTAFKITFEDGETRSETLKPKFPAKYVATIAPKDPTKFTGTYGIDWCDMDTSFLKIEKFQNTDSSNISHIFDEASSQFKSGGSDAEKQVLIKKMYTIDQYNEKDYPVTWMNLPKGKVATINIKTHIISGDDEDTDFLTIVKNNNFEISYNETTDKDTNPPIKLDKINKRKRKGTDIEITALNTFAQTEYILIQDYNGDEVGKIEMSPNGIEDLNVKIIPVVLKSTETDEKNEAVALYNKTEKAKTVNLGNNLEETFNQHSFNQAGLKCSIEPIKVEPERVVIDLTKNNWDKFYDKTKKELKDWDFNATEPDASKRPSPWESEDGDKFYEYKDGKVANNKRLLLDELEGAYYNEYGKGFKGALIFVTEENYYKPNTLGYSQSNPLRSQGTIIFKGGLSMSDAYAHELGHMLGLEHVFLKTDEVSEVKENIKTQETNITNYEKNIQGKKELIDYENKKISNETKNMENYGYNEDGSVVEQSYIDEQQIKISKFQEKIEEYNKEIEEFENKIKDFKTKISIEKGSGLKIKKGTSNNFMDYDISRLYFNKFQCLVMQQEVKSFYNE